MLDEKLIRHVRSQLSIEADQILEEMGFLTERPLKDYEYINSLLDQVRLKRVEIRVLEWVLGIGSTLPSKKPR